MITLTELLGGNDAAWMSDPRRNCLDPIDSPPSGAFADQWFPTEKHEFESAKKLCRGCPVTNDCLAYALERPELEGIWGSTTYTGRMVLRGPKRGAA